MAIIRRLTELLGRGGGARRDGERKRGSAGKKRRESFEAQLGITTLEDRILLSSTGLLPDDPNYWGGDQGSASFENSEPVSQPAASGWANDPNVAFYWEDPATFSDAFSQWLTANPLLPGADPILAVLAPFGNGVYHGLRLDIPVGVNLVIDGSAGGVNFVGASPALTVSGTLTLTGGTYQVSTDDPTILVQAGGSLTLDGVTVLESDLFNRAAILVEAGGSLNLSAGNNVISTRGAGQLLVWNSSAALSIASGNQLQQDGVTIGTGTRAQGFATEDRITHALDAATSGLVTWEPGSLYVTASSGSLARAVAVAPAASTIHVAAGTFVHDGQLNIDRSMTIIGAGQDQTILKRAAQVTVGTEDRTVQVNAAGVTFASLTFGGWNQPTTTANLGAGYLVWLDTAADRTTFDDIRFDGDDIRVGIYLHRRNDFTLTDSRFTGTYFRSAIRGAGERMLISRNTFEESHYKWGPIYMEYGAPTSGEISFNYFVSGIGVKNTALGSFDAQGEEFWSIANYQPHMTTADGLRIVHNTFHFDESGEVNQTGNQVVPQGVFIDPNSVRSGPITIQDNIFEGYEYTGPQPTAGPLWRPGQGVFGGALELTGNGQFGEFKSPDINLGEKGTYALWVNLDVTNKRHMLAGGAVEFQINGTRVYFYPGTQTTTLVQTVTGVIPSTPNVWTHLAFTWNKATNEGKIFVNGVAATLSNTITSWTTIRDTVDKVIYIGRDPGNPIARDFDGKMDDVAFFNDVLSTSDLTQIINQGVASLGSDPRLLAHWDFDQASGDVAVDNVRGIEMFITTDGVAHYQPAGPVFRTDQGKFGGALAFDGVDDFATFRDSSFDVGERGTLNFWVYSTNTAKRNQFFEGPGNAGFEVQYRTNSSGQVYARTATAPADFVIRSGSDGARLLNKWANIQVTWDFNGLPAADGGGKMRIYLDGVESGYLAGSTPTDLNWTGIVDTVDGLMNVGRDPEDNTRFFAGMMDDIAWFDGVLNATERADIRDGGVGTSALVGDSRLVAFWDLDDAVGTQIATGDGGTNISLYLQAAAPPAAPPMKQGYAINAVTGTVVANNVFFGNDVDYTSRVDDRGDNLFGDPNFNLTTDPAQHPYQVGFGGRATNWSSEYIADSFTLTPHVGAYQGLPGLFGGGDLWINGTGRDDTLEIVVTGPDAATARYTRDVGGPNEVVLDGIRLTSITGIHFLGEEGDDRFLLTQPTGGIFTPQDGIVFHGGTEDATLAGNPPPGDHFEMIGGATASLKYAFGVAGSGAILTSTPGYQYVRFTSVETLADGMTVDSREFAFPVATTKVVLADDPGRADSLLLTQELGASLGTTVSFRNPTALLTLSTDPASAATIEIDSLDPAFDADLTLATNVGDTVRFIGTLDLQGDLVVANADTITVTAGHAITTVGDGKVDFNAANQIVVDAGITTTGGGDVALTVGPTGLIRLGAPLASATGGLVVTGDVTLTADVQMTTGGGTIRVDGTIDGNRLLDLQAGSGTIDLLDSIGGMTPLLGLTAAAASVRFAGAQARVNDPVSNGFIRILGDLLLANDVTLTSDGVILLDGDVTSETSPRRLTLSAGETVTTTGDVTVKSVVVDAVGDVDFEGAVTASEYVRIRSDSAVTFDQSIRADELRIVASGDVAIVGDVTANSSATLQSLTGSVRLSSNLTSNVIDIDAKTTIDVDGAVSSVSLDLFAEGNITLDGAVTAATSVVIDSQADVILGSSLSSPSVDIDARGKVDIAGAVTSTTITIDAVTTVDVGGSIATTSVTINAGGNVTLDGAVTGTSSVVIDSAANVVVASTLGSAIVDIDADGLIQITGPVSATALDLLAVGNITITGAVTATTSATIKSQADVILGSSLTSALVDIDSVGKVDITGAINSTTITIDAGTTVDVGGAIATSSVTINAGGTVTLSGAVNGTALVVIDSAANVVIKSTLGTSAVDIDADGLIQITGPVSATMLDLFAVGNITITGAVTATTSAKIDSDAAVSLASSLTSPTIDIDAGTTVNVVGKIDSATLDIFAIGTVTLSSTVDATTSAKIDSGADVILGSSLSSPLVDIDALGKVDIAGAVSSTTITIDAATTVDVGGAISTSTLAINSGGTVTLSDAVNGTASVVIDSAANVVINSTLGTSAVDIDADGLIQITGPVSATMLDLLAVGNITITGAVTATTSAKIDSDAAVSLASSLTSPTIDIDAGTTVNVVGKIDSATLDIFAIGTVTLSGAVDATTSATIDSGADVILGSNLSSPSVDIDALGKVDIAGAVTSTTITIDAATTVDVGGAIATSSVTIVAGGNVTLSDAVNGTASVVIDSAANVVIKSTLGSAIVDIDADGLIQITGPVSATTLDLMAVGNITVTGAVTATTSAKIDSDGAVSLASSLTSPTIDIDAGTTVNVVGKIDSATVDIFAIGTVTLSGAVDATTSATIKSQADVILGSSLSSPLVDIDALGKVDIAGAVTSTTITIDAATTVDVGGAIATSSVTIVAGGNVMLDGAVNGTASVVIDSAANVVLASTLDSAAVDIDADGLIQITGPINATTLDLMAVGNITVTGAVTATTSAKIDSDGAVSLGSTLTSPAIDIDAAATVNIVGKVDSATLDIVAIGTVTLSSTVDATTSAKIDSGADVILGSSLSSPSVDIDALGKVDIAGAVTSTTITIDAATTVDVGGSITGSTLAVNAGGTVTLVGSVSGATSVAIDSAANVVLRSSLQGANVAIDAGGSVSVTGPITTTTGSIDAGGPVHLVGAVDSSTFGLVAGGNVTIDGDVIATTSLDIESGGAVVVGKTIDGGVVGIEATQGVTLRGGVTSDQLVVTAGGDVTFQSPVRGTNGISVTGKDFVFDDLSTVSGDVELVAKGTVHLQGDIDVGTGTILVETDNLAGVAGAVVQAPGVTMKTGNGGADAVAVIAARGGVTVSKIETGAGGTITIDAGGGSVVGRSPAPNLVSSTAVVNAGTGIDLQTQIAALRAVTAQGNIRIREADDLLLEQVFAKGARTGVGPQISVSSGGRISVQQGDAAAIQTSIGAVNNIPAKLRLGQVDPDDVLVSGDPTQEVIGTIGGLETEGDFREFGSNFRFRVIWNDGLVSELNTPLSSLVTQTGGAKVPTLQAGDLLVWKIDESNRSTLQLERPNWGANPPSGPIRVIVERTYPLRHLNSLANPEVTAKFQVFNDAQISLTDASGELLNRSSEIAITTLVSKELLRPSTVVIVIEPPVVVTEVKPVAVLQVTPPPQQQIVIYNQASLAGEADQTSVPHLYLVRLSVDGTESERVEIAIDELRDLAALLERLKNSAMPNGLYRIDYQDPGLPPQRVLEFRKAGEAIGDPVREPGIGSNPLEGATGKGEEAPPAGENGAGDPGVDAGAMRDPQAFPGKEVGSASAFRGSADYTQGAWSSVARQLRKWNARDGA